MKLAQFFQLLTVAILTSDRVTSAENILFLSVPYFGHINPMVKVAGDLTNYGHTSYIIISEEFKEKFSQVKKGINFVTIEDFPEFETFRDLITEVLRFRSNPPIKATIAALHKLCDRYLLDEEIFLKLKSLNASLAVVDANFASNFLTIFAYRLGIPFLLQGLHNQFNIHRTPWAISVFPHITLGQAQISSFSMKIRNVLTNFLDYLKPAIGSPGRNIKDYAPERQDISFEELLRQAQLYIVDSDHFLNPALPALPNVKYIGGTATQSAVPLKGKILEFVTASKNGVIVVSSGSLINWDISEKKMEVAFGKIKYDVVWRHTNSSYSRSNVLLTQWLPQNDLLGHPKTKLFITHCGNSGQYESLYHAVPMIGLPVVADEPFNSQNMQMKGFGISMDLNNFTVDELVRNIEEVIENPKYKKNIAKMSEIFRSQDLPSARAARLVNEILKYGGDHLRSEIQDIPLYQFLMLDILAVLFLAGFVILSLTVFLLRKCSILVCASRKKKTD